MESIHRAVLRGGLIFCREAGAMDGARQTRRKLAREQVDEYKRRVYAFGNIEKFIRQRIGAADRYGKPEKG